MSNINLLELLPEIFQKNINNNNEKSLSVDRYLKIIQFLLLRVEDGRSSDLPDQKGLGDIIDILKDLFHPNTQLMSEADQIVFKTYFTADREEFLEWLAGWFAFVVDEDWELTKKINVLSNVIPLYRKRGTKEGLQKYLELYKPGGSESVEIIDSVDPMIVGGKNTPPSAMQQLGKSTVLGGLPSNFFIVNISIPSPDPATVKEQIAATVKIIDKEKPAHTHYKINPQTPVMIVGVKLASSASDDSGYRCRIGIDTLLGSKYSGKPLTPEDLVNG